MSADVLEFENFAGSSRGLMARPIMPNDVAAVRSHVESIGYEIFNLTDGGEPVTGSLDPDDVMSEEAVAWDKDDEGRTFLWQMPGSLIPLPGKDYRIKVTFTQTEEQGGEDFIECWECATKDPDS